MAAVVDVTLREQPTSLLARLYASVMSAFTVKKTVVSSTEPSSVCPPLASPDAAKVVEEVKAVKMTSCLACSKAAASVVKEVEETAEEVVQAVERVAKSVDDVAKAVEEGKTVEEIVKEAVEVVEDVAKGIAEVKAEAVDVVEEVVKGVATVKAEAVELAKVIPVVANVPALVPKSE